MRYSIEPRDRIQDSRVLCTFVPNKPFGSLLEISPINYVFLKTLNSNNSKNMTKLKYD